MQIILSKTVIKSSKLVQYLPFINTIDKTKIIEIGLKSKINRKTDNKIKIKTNLKMEGIV
jgi:hypothetical protein